jgi:hypothetical protein
MTFPVFRTAALNASPGSVDAFKRLPGPSPERAQTTTRVPDVPPGKVALDLPSGFKCLFRNSEDHYRHYFEAKAAITGQNGKTLNRPVPLRTPCGGKHTHGPRRARVVG